MTKKIMSCKKTFVFRSPKFVSFCFFFFVRSCVRGSFFFFFACLCFFPVCFCRVFCFLGVHVGIVVCFRLRWKPSQTIILYTVLERTRHKTGGHLPSQQWSLVLIRLFIL